MGLQTVLAAKEILGGLLTCFFVRNVCFVSSMLLKVHGHLPCNSQKCGCCAEPYAKLARQMALPQTACLALPGPIGPVLGTPMGRAWYNEEDEDDGPTVRFAAFCSYCLSQKGP